MAALSDTPTPTMIATTSEAGGVSIKIEQGVLCDGADDYDGSGNDAERRGISPTTQYDIKYHPKATDMEWKNDLNGKVGDDNSMFSVSHNILHSDLKIKEEPPFNIDDTHPEVEENTYSVNNTMSPKIRLTPTSKLIDAKNGTMGNKRRYGCPYENCTKSYGKSSHLRSHLTWHTGIKPFVCKEPGCGKGFTRSDELNRHIRTHTGEKPFECVQCTKKFSRSDHLTKHLATHTKQHKKTKQPGITVKPKHCGYLQCQLTGTNCMQLCGQKSPELITDQVETIQESNFKVKQEMPENIEKHEDAITDQECNHNLNSALTSGPHLDLNIKTEPEPELYITPEPLNETGASESTEMSYENEPDDDAIMPEANLPPLTQCLAMGANTAMSTAMSQLVEPAQVRYPTLNRLTDSFFDPTRPFPCSKCPKNFKRQDDLNRHLRTHTGEKPYACNECDKRFMRSDHLKKHLNTHIRVR